MTTNRRTQVERQASRVDQRNSGKSCRTTRMNRKALGSRSLGRRQGRKAAVLLRPEFLLVNHVHRNKIETPTKISLLLWVGPNRAES